MNIQTKVKMGAAFSGMSEAEIARKFGTSPQNFHQRLKTGKFSTEDLEKIAKALGAELVCCFRFPDGTEI